MQLSLLSRLARPADESRRGPPSTVPGAWRDSAISQLDRIASADEQRRVHVRRQRARWLAVLGGVVLVTLAVQWRPAREAAPVLAAQQPAPARVSAPPPMATLPATPSPGRVLPDVLPTPASEPPASPDTVTDAAARTGRVAQPQAAETRRAKANQLAQERARASEEAQRLQRAQDQQQQQAEAEDVRRRQLLAERERAATVERAHQEAALLAQASRRDVQTLCASSGGGFIGEHFCQSRECRKAEHQGDAVCVRLREIEVARLQRGADH